MPEARITPKQQRGIDTRTRIIEAANAVYEEVGRDYFKTQTVQKQSGLSIGTIYRYFENRVALLAAVIEHRVSQGLEQPSETSGVPTPSPEAHDRGKDALEAVEKIKAWCQKVIIAGEGKADLKTAGEFMLREIEQRGL